MKARKIIRFNLKSLSFIVICDVFNLDLIILFLEFIDNFCFIGLFQ